MKSLLLFCFIACVNSNLIRSVLDNGWVDFGSYDALVMLGNLTDRYVPLTKDDLKASKNSALFLEEARRFFKTGFFTMPPLDPYIKQRLPALLIENDRYLSGSVVTSNLNVTGLVNFKNELLEIRLKNGRVDYRISVPQVNIETSLDVDLRALRIIPFETRGLLSLSLSGVVVQGSVHAVPVYSQGQRVFQVRAQHTLLHVADVKGQFISVLKSQVPPAFLSGGVGYDPSPFYDCFKLLKEHVDNHLANVVIDQANSILNGPTVEQVLAILLG